MLVPPASATRHSIMRVCFLCSVKNDEPELAEEEGSSADSPPTENRYETNNFLHHDIARLAAEQIMANCHSVYFKVITK